MQQNVLKMGSSATTDKELLFNFFMPVRKLPSNSTLYKNFVANGNVHIVNTVYGDVEIRNRLLYEKHTKILSAIIRLSNLVKNSNDSVTAEFKELDILKMLSMGDRNYTTLRNALKEIKDTSFYITSMGNSRSINIFDEHSYSSITKTQSVTFSSAYVEMYKSDFSIDMKGLLVKILNIEFPTIPTIVKFLLFKAKGKDVFEYSLNDVLVEIGFPVNLKSSLKTVRKNLKLFSETIYKDYNIKYDYKNYQFTCYSTDSIAFNKGLKTSFIELNSFINKRIILDGETHTIKKFVPLDVTNKEWQIVTDKKVIEKSIFFSDLLFAMRKDTFL